MKCGDKMVGAGRINRCQNEEGHVEDWPWHHDHSNGKEVRWEDPRKDEIVNKYTKRK